MPTFPPAPPADGLPTPPLRDRPAGLRRIVPVLVLLLSGCSTSLLQRDPPPAVTAVAEIPAPCPVDGHGWRVRNLSLPYFQQRTDCRVSGG